MWRGRFSVLSRGTVCDLIGLVEQMNAISHLPLAILICMFALPSRGADTEELLRQRIRINAALREVVLKDLVVDKGPVVDAIAALNAAIAQCSSDASALPIRFSERARKLKTWAKVDARNIGVADALDVVTCQTGTRAEVMGAEIVIDAGCDFAKDLGTRAFRVPRDFFALNEGRREHQGTRMTFSHNAKRIRDPHLLPPDPPFADESFGGTFDPNHDQFILCGTPRFFEKIAPWIAQAIQQAPTGKKEWIVVPSRDEPQTAAEKAEQKQAGHWSDVVRSAVVSKLDIRSSSIQSAFDAVMRAAMLPSDLRFEIRIDKAVLFANTDNISLKKLTDTSLDEVLRLVSELACAKFAFRSHGIEVLPMTASTQRLITRYYRVPWQKLEPVLAEPGLETNDAKNIPRDEQLLRAFKYQGIQFGDRTSITYDTKSGELMIRNTPANLDLCDSFLDSLANEE